MTCSQSVKMDEPELHREIRRLLGKLPPADNARPLEELLNDPDMQRYLPVAVYRKAVELLAGK